MTWQIGGDLGSGYTPPISPGIGGDLFPPSGTIIPFGFEATEWGDAWAKNQFQYATPVGIYELAFGDATILQTQQLFPAPFAADEYGSAIVQNWIRYLTPSGIAGACGQPSVENTSLGIFSNGWDSLVIGPAEAPHRISHYLALISPTGTDELLIGLPMVSDGIRFVSPTAFVGEFGSGLVTNYTQTTYPLGFRTDDFGQHEAGVSRTLTAFGADSLLFGSAFVRDDRQFSQVVGIYGALGSPALRNQRAFIRPDPASTGASWGGIEVVNRKQEAAVFWPAEFVAGPVSAPVVSLKDRTSTPLGFDALRFATLGPIVRLGPPPVEAGMGITSQWGFPLVAPRIRSVSTLGRSMDEVSSPIVLNAARNFTPVPFETAEYGRPTAINLWQFRDEITVGSTLEMGRPFIAPRVRMLIVNGMFTFEAGRNHSLGLSPRYLAALSIVGEFGETEVANRPVRVIGVRQDQPGTVERPAVANRNRPVFPMAFRTDTHGTPDVQNYQRFIRPDGIDAMQGGQHGIGPRVRLVRPIAISGTTGFHRVRLIPEPPAPQNIDAIGFTGNSSIQHSVSGNSIFVEGFDTQRFGDAAVVHYGIFPTGWNSLQMASTRPEVISYQRVLLGPTEEYPGVEDGGIGPPEWDLSNAPRVSPYTVWAPEGAPQQAKDNHPPGREEPVGIYVGETLVVGGVVPWPFVSNYLRSVEPDPIEGELGMAQVRAIGRQSVLLQGFRGRWGFPFLLGGNRTVSALGVDDLAFGLAKIDAPNVSTRTAQPAGITGQFGTIWVSRDPEQISPVGFDPLESGGGQGGYGGMWVSHEYPPFAMTGFDATEWGAAFVSPRPQSVLPFGWDSFRSEPDAIEDRMRVRARAFVNALGAVTEQFGTAWVERGQRTVTAFSVFHHSVPAPRVQRRGSVEGFDALTIPEPVVDQVEDGVLKAKGAASEDFGLPAIRAAIISVGIPGQFGGASVYHRLAPQGWSGAFGDVLVSGDDDHTCGMLARGVRHVWTEDEAFGDAEVVNG